MFLPLSTPLFGNPVNTGAAPKQISAAIPSINGKFHCITCTEGYNDKSLEELRWQYYQSGKKAPQQCSSVFGRSSQLLAKPNFLQPKANTVPFNPLSTIFEHNNLTSTNKSGNLLAAFTPASIGNAPMARNNLFNTSTSLMQKKQPFLATTQPNYVKPVEMPKIGTQPFSNLLTKPRQEIIQTPQTAFQFTPQPIQKEVNSVQCPRIGTTAMNAFCNQTPSKPAPEQLQQLNNAKFYNPLNAMPQCNPSTNLNSTLTVSSPPATKTTTASNLVKNSLPTCTGYSFPSQLSQPPLTTSLQRRVDDQLQQSHPLLLTDPFGYQPHFKGLTPLKQTIITNGTSVNKMQKYLKTPERISVSKTIKKIKTVQMIDRKSSQNQDVVSIRNFVLKKRYEDDGHKIRVIRDAKERNEPRLELQFVCSSDSFASCSDKNSSKAVGSDSNSTIPSAIQSGEISDNADSTTIDTCGITLTRPGYYTIPPLDKLAEYKQTNGECLVQGFTIGRVGFGSVSFPDIMNVANLNLDELVYFRYREIVVYEDESQKPALGYGLNRPAQVTLDNIYPKGKADGKLITDVQTLICINFTEKLINICEKQGTKFLDYRPETGSWVFMVKHFSKYKYYDKRVW